MAIFELPIMRSENHRRRMRREFKGGRWLDDVCGAPKADQNAPGSRVAFLSLRGVRNSIECWGSSHVTFHDPISKEQNMAQLRILFVLVALGTVVGTLLATGCADNQAAGQVREAAGTETEPVFVALEDVGKMKALPRGTVLTISQAMWESWAAKIELADFDPEAGQVCFAMLRLPSGSSESSRLAMLALCPDDAPGKFCRFPVRRPDSDFWDSWDADQPPAPCRSRLSFADNFPSCGGTCGNTAQKCKLVRSIITLGGHWGWPIMWCRCVN